jgi:hypothetical protein
MQQDQSNAQLRCVGCGGDWDQIDQASGDAVCNHCDGVYEGDLAGRRAEAAQAVGRAVERLSELVAPDDLDDYLAEWDLRLADDPAD